MAWTRLYVTKKLFTETKTPEQILQTRYQHRLGTNFKSRLQLRAHRSRPYLSWIKSMCLNFKRTNNLAGIHKPAQLSRPQLSFALISQCLYSRHHTQLFQPACLSTRSGRASCSSFSHSSTSRHCLQNSNSSSFINFCSM